MAPKKEKAPKAKASNGRGRGRGRGNGGQASASPDAAQVPGSPVPGSPIPGSPGAAAAPVRVGGAPGARLAPPCGVDVLNTEHFAMLHDALDAVLQHPLFADILTSDPLTIRDGVPSYESSHQALFARAARIPFFIA